VNFKSTCQNIGFSCLFYRSNIRLIFTISTCYAECLQDKSLSIIVILTLMFISMLSSVENTFCSRSSNFILEFMFHDGHIFNLLAYKSKVSRFIRSSIIFGNVDN